MPGKPFGVIEGFYGDPWTTAERLECIDVLAANGGDTYVWAPKSEPRHRDRWEEPVTPAEIDGFALLISR
ncbi:MAG: beta-N-acetylglucosaminidase domain-containing protein, partial [Actinomycetes bacterium]